MTLSAWLRVIRVRFLMASVISVTVGLSAAWHHGRHLDIFDAGLTMAGVLALHASVDLLNDYWDFRRGIDTQTKRTKMSGGSGVLPDGLLAPSQVYRAGLAALAAGAAIGAYFVVTDGLVIAVILAFAVLSIYFYSGRIVDWGLGEIFVGIKGAMIVLGTYYIQTQAITAGAVAAGISAGILSALVLFVVSFPDYRADGQAGRKNTVVWLGPRRASRLFWPVTGLFYLTIIISVWQGLMPWPVLAVIAATPLAIRAGLHLRTDPEGHDILIRAMSATVLFGRISGALLAAGFVAGSLYT